MIAPVERTPSWSPLWGLVLVLLVLGVSAALIYPHIPNSVQKATQEAAAADARYASLLAEIPEDLSEVNAYDLERFSVRIGFFKEDYTKEDGTYVGEKVISASRLSVLERAIEDRVYQIKLENFTSYYPKQLIPEKESSAREDEAVQQFGENLPLVIDSYLLSFHAQQLEYALLALYLFPSNDVSRWEEVRELFVHVEYERTQIGEAIPTQEIYKFGPPTVEEAQHLRDLAYKRLLLQALEGLRAKNFTYPDSTFVVDDFFNLQAASDFDLKQLGTSVKELEELRLRDPELPGEVRPLLLRKAVRKAERPSTP